MHLFQGPSIDHVYPDLIDAIFDDGERHSPRGQETIDLGLTAIEISDPSRKFLTNKIRRINPYFLFAEMLWIMTSQNRVDMISHYNKRMLDFSDDGKTLYGAYGPRLMMQIPTIVSKIKADPSTRQAIATIFRPNDTRNITKDFPCNIMLHFLPKNGRIDLVVYVRSQDIYLGFPYDFYHWATLLQMVCGETGLSVGKYTHICGSLHAYTRNSDILNDIAEDTVAPTVLNIQEMVPNGLLRNPRAVATIEYNIRKNPCTEFMDEGFIQALGNIESLNESDFIKDVLKVLLYYKIRRTTTADIDTILDLPYASLIKHLGWK